MRKLTLILGGARSGKSDYGENLAQTLGDEVLFIATAQAFDEVGLGIVPDNRLSRIYRDVLGRANQRLAQTADRVVLQVAGIPLVVKDGLTAK